ncbi:MAG: hypothetical protein BWX48_03344 [Verrucomicrobia bacterium ADurb.Bin006]|jgi:hypothetical protein|nr:MAG: hypothetical protein BWX48_03344 [Verrucomicrobia bacterium ADurb.Bin006]
MHLASHNPDAGWRQRVAPRLAAQGEVAMERILVISVY